MTLSELLAQYDLTEDDLSTSLERRLSIQPLPTAAELTVEEEAFWSRHAGVALADPDGPEKPDDRYASGASSLARATDETVSVIGEAARSMTIEQAADVLGIHRSRVSHRLRDGRLYAYHLGTQRRIPRWQLTSDSRPLPGLETVLASLPADLHPTAVEGFFTTPDPDLDGVTPAHWLASGGDPQRVVDEAAGIDQW